MARSRQTKAANVRTIQAAVRSGTIERPTRGKGSKGDFRSYLRGLKPQTLERKARAAEKLQSQGARNVPYAATRGHARVTPEGIVRSREHNPQYIKAVFHEKSGKMIRPPQWKVVPASRDAVLRTLAKIKGPMVRVAAQGTVRIIDPRLQQELLEELDTGKFLFGQQGRTQKDIELNVYPNYVIGAAWPLADVQELARNTFDPDTGAWEPTVFAERITPLPTDDSGNPTAEWVRIDHFAFGEGKL